MRCNAELDTSRLNALCQGLPLRHSQDGAKMGYGYIMAIDGIVRGNAARASIKMRHNLVAKKVEINPLVG
jgi:hypothetical protein